VSSFSSSNSAVEAEGSSVICVVDEPGFSVTCSGTGVVVLSSCVGNVVKGPSEVDEGSVVSSVLAVTGFVGLADVSVMGRLEDKIGLDVVTTGDVVNTGDVVDASPHLHRKDET
jgi:hypothetical protein